MALLVDWSENDALSGLQVLSVAICQIFERCGGCNATECLFKSTKKHDSTTSESESGKMLVECRMSFCTNRQRIVY